MKRNASIEREMKRRDRYWGPTWRNVKDILPPRSLVRVTKTELDDHLKVGTTFRIGYYSPQDGPDCVWLVNAAGEYEQTWDQVSLLETFDVVERSDETDIFGRNRPRLKALAS